jgi:hypothetical protein
MPSIQDVRKQYPQDTAGLTDYGIAEKFASANSVPVWKAAEELGVEIPRVETGLFDSLQRGLGIGLTGVGSIARDVPISAIQDAAGWVERQGRGVIERNPAQYNTTEDIMASPISAFAEKAAEGVGQFLPALAATAVTKNPYTLGAIMAANSAAGNVGETRSRQRELGQDSSEDILRAWAYGVPQVALDVALGPESLLLKGLAGGAGRGLTEAAAREVAERGVLATMGRGALYGAQEAPQEVAQSVLGRMATKEALTGADATEEYAMSAFGGLAGGMTMGAGIAPVQRAGASKFVDQIDAARQTLTTGVPQTYEEAQQWLAQREQATDFLRNVTENDFGLHQAEAFAAQQVGQQRTILDEAASQRQKEVDARIADQRETQEIEAMYEADTQRQEQLAMMPKALSELAKQREGTIPYTPASLADIPEPNLSLGVSKLRSRLPVTPETAELPAIEFASVTPPAPAEVASTQMSLPGMPYGGVLEAPTPVFAEADRFRAALAQLQLSGMPQPEVQAVTRDLQKVSGFQPEIGFGTQPSLSQLELLTKPAKPTTVAKPMPEVAAASRKPSRAAAAKIAVSEALARQKITPEQAQDFINEIDASDGKNAPAVLETLNGLSRPPAAAAEQRTEGQNPDAGASVGTASVGGVQPATDGQPGTAGGVVPSDQQPNPVAAAAATPVKENQDGLQKPQGQAPAQKVKEPRRDRKTKNPQATQAPQRPQGAETAEAPAAVQAGEEAEVLTGGTPDAVQEQSASEGVSRRQEPEVGLQEVGEGNAVDEVPAEEGQAEEKVRMAYPDNTGYPPEAAAYRNSVVDAMNGDISRAELKVKAVESGLPEGQLRAFTSRFDGGFTNTEHKEIEDARKAAETPVPALPQEALTKREVPDEVADLDTSEQDLKGELTALLDPKYGVRTTAKATRTRLQTLVDDFDQPDNRSTPEDRVAYQGYVRREMDKLVGREGIDYSKTVPNTAEERTTPQKIRQALRSWFITPEQASSRLVVSATPDELPTGVKAKAEAAEGFTGWDQTQAFVLDGKGYMIADNIAAGNELAVFMHEIGAHIGLDGQESAIMGRVNLWSTAKEGTTERQVYDAMQSRMEAAGETSQTEQVAYAVEEAVKAGVTPKAVKTGMKLSDVKTAQDLVNWLAQYFKAAVDKVFKTNTRGFNAQQLVDLTYGAAREAMDTQEVGAGKTAMSKTEPQFSKSAEVMPQTYRKILGDGGVQVYDQFRELLSKVANEGGSLSNMVRRMEKTFPVMKQWHDVMIDIAEARTVREQVADDILSRASLMGNDSYKRVAEFVYNSTWDQKWAYDPEFTKTVVEGDKETLEKVEVKVDPTFAKEFKALSAEEQQLVKDIFAHGHNNREALRGIMRKLKLDDRLLRVTQLDGPYAPLRRFGQYVAEVKSQRVMDLERQLEAAKDTDDETQSKGFSAIRKELTELKRQEQHYSLTFHDTIGVAKKKERDMLATGRYSTDPKAHYAGERLDQAFSQDEMPQDVLQRVMGEIKAASLTDDKVAPIRAQLESMVTDMYQRTTEDHLARQAMKPRKYRFGADTDMIRSFGMQAKADAIFLAHMEHGGRLNGLTSEMYQKARKSKDPKIVSATNTALTHQRLMAEYKETPVQDTLKGAMSIWQLGLNPAYHVQNATQTVMKSAPMIASEFAGDPGSSWTADYVQTMKLITEGYKDWAKYVKDGKIQFERIPAGLREAMQHAARRNLIDVGLIDDFDQLNRWDSGFESVNALTLQARKFAHRVRQVARHVERMNRVTAASAAYKMAIAKGRTQEQAEYFAIRVLEDTQGDNSRLDAPLIIKRLPKVLTIYKRYQLMVAALYTKAFHDAFRGADAATRAVGRRMLGLQLMHAFAMGGVLGLPLVNIAQLVLPHLFGDDDAPKDEDWLERQFREMGVPTALLKGGLNAAIGLDMGAKLGDQNVFSILPFTDIDFTSKKGVMDMAVGMMGPVGTEALRMADGLELIKQGNTAKGVEKLVPRGVTNGMQAWRLANEGITVRNGDVLVQPEDLSTYQLFLKGLGMPPAQLNDYQWIQSQQIEVSKFYREKEQTLRNRYARAAKAGDTAEMQDLADTWENLQAAKGNFAPYFNNSPKELKAKPLRILREAPEKQQKREADAQARIPEEI